VEVPWLIQVWAVSCNNTFWMEAKQRKMLVWLSSIVGIVLVDLVLSGDNAVVIGAAASRLPRKQRRLAILIGGCGAVLLRIVFALMATLLLQLDFIGIFGSIILLFIAFRLLWERSKAGGLSPNESLPPAKGEVSTEGEQQQLTSSVVLRQEKHASRDLLASITTILVADVTMSLDNVLAIGGLAAGDTGILVIGLLVSIIFLLLGSVLVAEWIGRLPWLLDVACLIVAWSASQIFLGDDSLKDFFDHFSWTSIVAPVMACVFILIADIYLRVRDHRLSPLVKGKTVQRDVETSSSSRR
jgi:YjbE family integral membrane protein